MAELEPVEARKTSDSGGGGPRTDLQKTLPAVQNDWGRRSGGPLKARRESTLFPEDPQLNHS